MATQTHSNSFRARTRLKSAMSGASFRVLLWPHSTARNRSDLLTLLGTTHGNSHSSKPFCGLLETLFGLLSQNIGPDSSKPSPRDRKTLLRTAQNQLEATSGRLRDHFGAASGPPDYKTALSRTTQNQLEASSRPLLGLQAAKHRSEPLKTSSKPARDTAQHRSKPARGQLETSSNISEAHISWNCAWNARARPSLFLLDKLRFFGYHKPTTNQPTKGTRPFRHTKHRSGQLETTLGPPGAASRPLSTARREATRSAQEPA